MKLFEILGYQPISVQTAVIDVQFVSQEEGKKHPFIADSYDLEIDNCRLINIL